MEEARKMGRLIYVSENRQDGKKYFVLEDEQHEVFRLCVDVNKEIHILEDMSDIAIGDIVKLYKTPDNKVRAQLAVAHRSTLSKKHLAYINTIKNAEDHISNGIKDQALTEATQWLMRYMGVVKEVVA